MQASTSSSSSEAEILKKLQNDPSISIANDVPVPRLHDSFDLKGPNGLHKALAMEPLGRSLAEIVFKLYMNSEHGSEDCDVEVLRQLSRMMINAVRYVHSREIAHRGLVF